MERKDFWDEGMDEKRFALCFAKRVWIMIAAALAGALFAGGLYLAVQHFTAGPDQYRAEVLYAIRYNVQEEDEVLKAFINEYNAYTWGDMMRSDKVMELVMKELPDLERKLVEESLSTLIASDPEFLTAQFTTADAALSDRIAKAFNKAMPQFGETLKERGLTAIEAWKTSPAVLTVPENKVKNAMVLGLVLGALAGLAGLAVWYVLDDSVLTEQDLEGTVPFIGYRTKKGNTDWDRQLEANLAYLQKKEAVRQVDFKEIARTDVEWENMKKGPVVLCLDWGKVSKRLLRYTMGQLKDRKTAVAGIVLTEAESSFLNLYYGKKKAGLLTDKEA